MKKYYSSINRLNYQLNYGHNEQTQIVKNLKNMFLCLLSEGG